MASTIRKFMLPLTVALLLGVMFYPAIALFAQEAGEDASVTDKTDTWRRPQQEDRGNVLDILKESRRDGSDARGPEGVPEEWVEARERAQK